MTENTTEQERAAYERELIDNHHYVPSDFSFKDGFYGGDDDYIQFGWDLWQAARRDTVPVPQGWKLVPEEASSDMVNAGEDAFCGTYDYAMIPDVYAAMLSAAPQPPEAAPVGLPEPIGEVVHAPEYDDGLISWYTASPPSVGTKLYTEQQVRELLAAHGIEVAP